MKLKKITKAPTVTAERPAAPEATGEAATAASAGGATIADRFKLDLQDPNAAKPVAGLGVKIALAAAVLALAAAGFLVFTLWKHWEFLMPA